ncbi:ABC-type transport auxiliary lipoprotein family protein [Phenylobacterium sp.]|jgi:cholesterol transport system auxiliary component|uniref:ABC-type transport auxiliary lipoprotein family protein n=1 Tax=Phenylobacterium sp. TaxID=1871053 RepID=UPI002F420BFD
MTRNASWAPLRLATLGLTALALSGCISLLPKTKPAQLYSFAPAPAAKVAAPAPGGVAVFRSNGQFQEEASDDRILTVIGGKAAYIADTRWVAPAETLFNEAVANAFDASPIRLIARGQQGRFGYALRIDVRSFEARYDHGAKAPPTVVVHIHAALTKADQTGVGEQDFEASAPASDNRVTAIVAAFRKATDEAIGKLVTWTEANATQPTA